MLILKVGMTHSYGNGRRLDDSKALGELDFQVKLVHELSYLKVNEETDISSTRVNLKM